MNIIPMTIMGPFWPKIGSANQKIEFREFFLRVLQYVGRV